MLGSRSGARITAKIMAALIAMLTARTPRTLVGAIGAESRRSRSPRL
jgi:hypothetical protein